MSDPAKTDIEDVLSSIRRLLAQDVPPRERLPEPLTLHRLVRAEPGPFVVDVPDPVAQLPQGVSDTSVAVPTPHAADVPLASVEILPVDDSGAKEGISPSAEAMPAIEAEPEQGLTAPERAALEPESSMWEDEEEAMPAVGALPAWTETFVDQAEEEQAEDPFVQPHAPASLEDTLAALEAAVSAHAATRRAVTSEEEVQEAPFIAIDMPEPEHAEVAHVTVPFRHDRGRRLQLVPPVEADQPIPEPLMQQAELQPELTTQQLPQMPSRTGPLLPAPDEIIAEVHDIPAADTGELELSAPIEEAGMPADWDLADSNDQPEHQDAEDTLSEPAAVEAVQDEAETDWTAGEAPLLDEAVLREIVAEILREELQGALGERMTRNVRKLVRAEIRRALAGHDLP